MMGESGSARANNCFQLDNNNNGFSDRADKQHKVPHRFTCYILTIFASLPTLDLMHRLKLNTLKARLPSKSQTENKQTFYLANSTIFATAQAALNIFKEIAEKTGVPGLQDGVKALVIILDAMQVWLSQCM
jgi:hypothetical protein